MKKMTEQLDDRLKSALLDLTWKKMKEWADPGSVERGRGYLDNVEEPRRYPDGSVIAEVHGSEDYHTRLHIDDDGKLQGDCSCPVGYRCKHAVALALVAIKKFKAGEEMRRGATDDSLWKCAMSELAAWEPVEEDDDDDDDGKLSVAYDLDEFLDSYWFDAAEYRALREKCERFNVWERVHEFILRHLSSGCDLAAEEGWPLPKTGTSTTNDRIEGYPKLTLLIQIAMEDGRPKDALIWYGLSVSGHGGIREYELDKLGWEVADAVVDCKPAEAVEIWLGYVHRNEREPGNSHYNQIGRAMQKLLPVMRSLGRLDEWRAEMSRLRESYCRRPNLMSILKDVESGGNSIDLLKDY